MLRIPGFLRIPPMVEPRRFLLKHIKNKVGWTSDFSYHFYKICSSLLSFLSNLDPPTHPPFLGKSLSKYQRMQPPIRPHHFQAARRMLKPCWKWTRPKRVHNLLDFQRCWIALLGEPWAPMMGNPEAPAASFRRWTVGFSPWISILMWEKLWVDVD